MEKENSSSKPRRYEPSNDERVNGTSNNEDSEDEAEGEYLEVKNGLFTAAVSLYRRVFTRVLLNEAL